MREPVMGSELLQIRAFGSAGACVEATELGTVAFGPDEAAGADGVGDAEALGVASANASDEVMDTLNNAATNTFVGRHFTKNSIDRTT